VAEIPVSDLAVYRARPTVRVDGRENERINELLIAMSMNESEGGMSALELRFSNVASDPRGGADLAFEDNSVLKLGASIAVYGGDENQPREIFRGIITGLEGEFPLGGPPELIVLAEDKLQEARMRRRTKVYENMAVAEIARQIASDLGLRPVINASTGAGTEVQLNESDLAFLRRLALRYDLDVQVVADELHLTSRSEVRRGTIELELHSQLRRARILADLSHQATKVTVRGWDRAAKRGARGESTGSHLSPGTGQTGKQILQNAIGERSHHLAHLAPANDGEASAAANSAFDLRARRFVCVDGTAEGNPALRVGTHVALVGVGPRFSNTYYVVRACHRYDVRTGYETDFEAECAFLGV
jgi:uncharacterized protein